MALTISKANPLRFRPMYYNYIDYNNYYPKFDLMQFGEEHQRGIYPVTYYPKFPLNDTITIQIKDDLHICVATVVNAVTGARTTMTESVVTPPGWVNGVITNYSIDTNTLGVGTYRIEYFSQYSTHLVYITDDFAIEDPSVLKDLVKTQYYDSENKFDGVFNNGTDWIWQPTRYFTGHIITGEGGGSYSMYKDESETPSKINAEVLETMVINLTDISQYEKPIVDRIFGCDNILINDVSVQNEDKPEFEPTEKTDICDITINATITQDNNDSYNFS